MARPLRIEFADALYHVTARGNAKAAIFLDDDDRRAFLEVLEVTVGRFDWRCLAYCLMANHYHLVLATPRPNLSSGMCRLNGTYAQRFNRRHGRVGHVLGGRFSAILIEREPHLLEVARYVVLNPVRAGMCRHPAQWRWSSFRATVGAECPPRFLDLDGILGLFADDRPRAHERYRTFVDDANGVRPWDRVVGEIYLGGESFASERSAGVRPRTEIPRPQWQPVRVPLASLVRDRSDAAGMAMAYRDHGYRLGEIAAHLRLSYSTVSRRLRAAELTECKT